MEVKHIEDYYDQIQERFPDLPSKDLKRILKYGWRSLYLHNSYGGDVLLQSNNIWCYIGFLTNDSIKHFRYYVKKLIIKLRVLFHRKKNPFDGYYYFALSPERQALVDAQKNTRGRKKKWIDYGNVILYKILGECKLSSVGLTHIYRVPFPIYVGCLRYKEHFISDCAELIEVQEPPKFKDLLVTNYDYELL